jgi:hypothetical protein
VYLQEVSKALAQTLPTENSLSAAICLRPDLSSITYDSPTTVAFSLQAICLQPWAMHHPPSGFLHVSLLFSFQLYTISLHTPYFIHTYYTLIEDGLADSPSALLFNRESLFLRIQGPITPSSSKTSHYSTFILLYL